MDDLKLHGLIGGGSNIKSIQRGSIDWATALQSKDISITAVNINKSIIMIYPYGKAISTGVSNLATTGEFVDSTTIRFKREGTESISSLEHGVYWEVIEFENVRQKQSGFKTYTSWTQYGAFAITSVNPNKSLLVCHSRTLDSTNFNGAAIMNAISLISPTQIYAYPMSSKTLHWQLIEFK